MLRRALAVAVVVAAGVLPGCSSGGGDGYQVTAYFDKAVSLYEASDVKVLGLSAGTVDEIEVEGTRVRVRMTINGDQPLPADVQATIVPFSLIGERYVQLFPAWTPGQPRAQGGLVIPAERTTIPTEPDEALAALKKLLDSLDPNATGRLVTNLADDLRGNGQGINDALRGLADLTSTLAAKDAELVGIIENFDTFTAALRTRERQLGQVMDQFASATSLLAEERENIAKLVDSLSRLSADGLDLVNEHGSRLDRDLTTLTRVLQSVRANIDAVGVLLDSGPTLVAGDDFEGTEDGLIAAWDPTYHHIDLRNAAEPTLAQFLDSVGFGPVQGVCLPLDVDCEATPGPTSASASRASRSQPMGNGGGMLRPLESPAEASAQSAAAPLPELSMAVPAKATPAGSFDSFKRMVRGLMEAAW
ncbi:MAG TPA: MCE family protein [Acidimicrobiales bacterium]|nr:MCE family protein [Acidimicrobiales bacterium]